VTVADTDWLAQRFEANRPHLRAVAYRMLGSVAEADDVVQDAWFRLERSDTTGVDNLGGWLTTVVARLCLDALRTRKARKEEPTGLRLPEPMVGSFVGAGGPDPEQEALLADSVGLAMMVVLDALAPAERLAFVLHDVFAMPFDEIAPIVDRTPEAARQLASRARRRVRGARPESDVDLAGQRQVVTAFLAAARDGNFEALLQVLDPDVVARADFGAKRAELNRETRGAGEVAQQAMLFRNLAPGAREITINGSAGLAAYSGDRLFAVLGFTVRGGRIVEIDIVGDPERLRGLGG
jgi:RNA polymerase sigma factor (sigma-70 family)